MSETPLTPEQRTDKNGVTSTRWMRPQGHRGTPMGNMLPAPVDPKSAGIKQLTREAIEEMRSLGMEMDERMDGRRAVYTIIKEDPALMHRIMGSIHECSAHERSVWEAQLTKHHGFPRAGNDWSEVSTEYERLIQNTKMIDLFEGRDAEVTLNVMNTSVTNGEQILGIKPGRANYTKVQAGVIMTVIGPFPVNLRGRDKDLDYISQHIDEIIPLVPQLKERGTSDRGVIELLINNASPSLSDGVL
jgi:hypothetical protein